MSDEHPQHGLVARTLAAMLSAKDLPGDLPADPMPLLIGWLDEAKRSGRYDDHNAMTLATATAGGVPSARIVLCKAVEADPPALVFFTNYLSRKGRELTENPNAAAVFHWPHAGRQARVEGVVERTTAAESDAYFDSRPLISRIGAIVSRQSEEIESRTQLIESALREARGCALGARPKRPDHWGGYRLRVNRVELWSAGSGRLHDRLCWTRGEAGAGWTVRRLSP